MEHLKGIGNSGWKLKFYTYDLKELNVLEFRTYDTISQRMFEIFI